MPLTQTQKFWPRNLFLGRKTKKNFCLKNSSKCLQEKKPLSGKKNPYQANRPYVF